MLTAAQYTALAAYIAADATLMAFPHTADGAYEIAQILNSPASPTFTVWRTNVTQDEIMQNGFDWVQVDNLSVGKARIWEWMFNNQSRVMNPSKANVRLGIDECWKGTAAMLAVRDAIYVHCKRSASVAEKLFATGTGSSASPANLVYEGKLIYQDITQAMGW